MTAAGPLVSTTEVTPALGTSKIVGYDGSSYGHFDMDKLFDPYRIENYLINPHHLYYERVTPTVAATYTNITDATFGTDRWYSKIDFSGIQQRTTIGTADVGGNVLQLFNNAGGARTVALIQVVPSHITRGLRGKILRHQLTATCNLSATINQRLFEWTSTADSSSIKSIITGFSSGTPTFSSTNYTSLLSSSTALTTSFARYGANASAVSTSANNLVWVTWCSLPTTATLQINGCGLHSAKFNASLYPRFNELSMCQAYGARIFPSAINSDAGFGVAFNANTAIYYVTLPQPLRAVPTLSIGSVTDWSNWNRALATQVTCSSLAFGTSSAPNSLVQTITAGIATSPWTAGQFMTLRALGASALLFFDAEI